MATIFLRTSSTISRHPLSPKPSSRAMGSGWSPPSTTDINDFFNEFINEDCLLSEVPNTLASLELTFRSNLLQEHQWQPQQQPSPAPTPTTNCASITEMHPPSNSTSKLPEPHLLTTETRDLPPREDTFDPFNFGLAAPHTSLANHFVATSDKLIYQPPATPLAHMLSNATTGGPPQCSTQYIPLPPRPVSLSSTTTSSAATAPPLTPPSTIHPAIIPTSTSITLSPTTGIPTPNPYPRKTFSCTSPHCSPTTTVRNPETAHHHHHIDPKHRFCCRYEACTSCTSYTTRKDCNRHEASKHIGQQLICDVSGCGHQTARADNMRVHVRRAHGEGWEVIMKRIVRARMRAAMGSG